MKKTGFALSLLFLLALLSFWNIRHLHSLTEELSRSVEEAQRCAREEDFDRAEAALDRALTRWLRSDGYTHVFIRHSEIDAATDIFYDLREALLSHDREGAEAQAEKLLYHLRSIYTMERVSVKSVF